MKILRLLAWMLIFANANAAAFNSQSELSEFAKHTQLQFAVKTNFDASGSFIGQLVLRNNSKVALAAGDSNWQIYLHSIRKLNEIETSGLRIAHVQGDLHRITPTASFCGLAIGASLQVEFTGANWIVSYSDFMPRTFIVVEGLKPEVFFNTDTENLQQFVLPFTRPEQQLRTPDDHYLIADAQSRFTNNLDVNGVAGNVAQIVQRIFPTPKNVEYSAGSAMLDKKWRIAHSANSVSEARYLQHALQQQAGLDLALSTQLDATHVKSIRLIIDSSLSTPESYRLIIGTDVISISGSDSAGVFYGVQSLLSLIPAEHSKHTLHLPLLHADDAPRYAWRGMHYDMARNFHGKQVTLGLIEQMSRFKLNKLHLHLTDDEGWRLQIPGLPELTDIGANRCFDLSEQRCLLTQLGTGPNTSGTGNGYYSVEDFIEILAFAKQRHIEVIPEIDMPGHSRAAIKSMQARYTRLLAAGNAVAANQYLLSDPLDNSVYSSVQSYNDNSVNVCQESSYQFVEKIVAEIRVMYQRAGLRLDKIHIGGDEVGKGSWLGSPRCQALSADAESKIKNGADLKQHFVNKLSALLQMQGIALLGWEDGLMRDATTPFERARLPNTRVIANVWDNIWEWGVADRAYRLANADYQVVLSHATHLYFDHPQEPVADERGYYWASRFTNNEKVFGYMPDNIYANADKTRMGDAITNLEKTVGRHLTALEKPDNILGMQGQVWSETIRTPEQLEQMIYPRMLLMAERAWHKAAWEEKPDTLLRNREWAEMAQLLALRELPKLQAQGAMVYLPTPGVQVNAWEVMANTALPGLMLEYSADNGKTWQAYKRPIPVKNRPLCFRSRASSSQVSRMQCVQP